MSIFKRTAAFVFSVLLVFSLVCSTFTIQISAAEPTPVLSAESKKINDTQYTVDVYLKNATSVYGGNFTLEYDNTLLTADTSEFGSIVSGHTKNCNLDYQSKGNQIRVSFSGSSALTADGTIVTFTFTAKKAGSANLKFTEYKIYDENGKSITASASGSTVTINDTRVILTGIEVKTNPTKTTYFVGDTLDTTGLTITAFYNNNSSSTKTEGFTCSPQTFDTAGTKTITVTYKNKTTTFDVTVNTVELSAIEVSTKPSKTLYVIGDTLSTSGLKLKATYNNGTTEIITEGFTCTPETLDKEGTQEITVTYSGLTTTFNVTVETVKISKIEIADNPTKTAYYTGDTLNTAGLTLKATYNDGTTKTITEGFTCTPETLDKEGTQEITVTYAEKTAKFNVTVTATAITGIKIQTLPEKTAYIAGEQFDKQGLSVLVLYNNGTTETITSGFSTNGYSPSTVGEQTITVAYKKFTTTFVVTVSEKIISVTGISLNKTSTDIYKGYSETLKATVTPDNATDASVTWESSDTAIATVDSNGKVTGIEAGSATITATTTDGNFTASCEVTIKNVQFVVICLHQKTTVHNAVKSTCTKQGHGKYTSCDKCGEIIEGSAEKLPLADHTGGTATCKQKAICFICGNEYGDYTQHEPEHFKAVDADHNSAGNIEYWYCTICDSYFEDADCSDEITKKDTVTAKIPHKYSNDADSDEYQHWYSCSCGAKTEIQDHEYENICDDTCDICGYMRSYAHDWNSDWSYDDTEHWLECKECGIIKDSASHTGGTATCTEKAVCLICNTEYGRKDTDNHSGETVLKNTEEATCTTSGYSGDVYCEDCDNLISKGTTIPATGHTETILPGKSATCSSTGLTEGKKCSVCNEITVAQKEIPATAHNYKTKTTAPTCTESGYTTYTCSCGDKYTTNYVNALGHNIVTIKGNAATCTKKGLTNGKKCSVCGLVTIKQTEIAAKGHSFSSWTVITAPTAEKEGTEERICSSCGTKESRSIAKISYILGDVNGDSRITAADARIVLRTSAKLEKLTGNYLIAADVNKDDKITAADARTILRVSAKLEQFR